MKFYVKKTMNFNEWHSSWVVLIELNPSRARLESLHRKPKKIIGFLSIVWKIIRNWFGSMKTTIHILFYTLLINLYFKEFQFQFMINDDLIIMSTFCTCDVRLKVSTIDMNTYRYDRKNHHVDHHQLSCTDQHSIHYNFDRVWCIDHKNKQNDHRLL